MNVAISNHVETPYKYGGQPINQLTTIYRRLRFTVACLLTSMCIVYVDIYVCIWCDCRAKPLLAAARLRHLPLVCLLCPLCRCQHYVII